MKKEHYTIHEMELIYLPKYNLSERPKIHSSEDVANLLKQIFNPNTIQCQEEFIVLYMNNSNRVIGSQKLSKGGICSTIVDVRLIMSTALKSLATAIILSHNHPSGNCHPSENDKKITARIKDACKFFEITLLDHLILTPDHSYYSFADESIL